MCANTFEQDGFFAFVFHKFEDHAQIITGAARPRADELAFEFVRLELRMKRILREQGQHGLQFRGRLRLLAGKPATGTNECSRWQKQPFQAKRRLTI